MARLGAVDAVISGGILVVSGREARDEFIAPLPQPLVGWPAAVATGFFVDDDVLLRGGLQRSSSGWIGFISADLELSIRSDGDNAAEQQQ